MHPDAGSAEGADLFNNVTNAIMSAGTPGNRRAILRGLGGTAGIFMGLPLGPVGSGTGGLIGDFAGSRIANVLDDIYGSDGDENQKKELAQEFLDDVWSSVRDNTVGAAAGRYLPSLWYYTRDPRRLLGRFMRLPPNSLQLFREAEEMGVDIGVANLTGTGGLGGGLVNVFSRMPFMGTTAKELANTQAKRLVNAQGRLFERVGDARSMSTLSEEALQAGQRYFEDRATKAMARFEHAARVGTEAGPILNPTAIKDTAKEIIQEAYKAANAGNPATAIIPKNMRTVLGKIQQYPDKVTTNDIVNLKVWIENNMHLNKNMQYPMMTKLREAADKVLRTSDHPAAKLTLAAEQNFDNMMAESSDYMMKNFGTMKKQTYGSASWKEGTRTADDVARMLEQMDGPAQVQRLRTVVGDETIQSAARLRIDAAWDAATGLEKDFFRQQMTFDASKFNKVLGLDNPDSRLYKSTVEMLRGTGVSVDELGKLARVAELVANVPLGDTSTFVMRAAVLKGSAGLRQALQHSFALATYGAIGGGGGAVAGSAGGGLASAIAFRTVVNGTLGQMLKPGLLKTLIATMEPTVPNLQALKNVPGASPTLQAAIAEAERTQNTTPAQIQALFHLFKTAPTLVYDAHAP